MLTFQTDDLNNKKRSMPWESKTHAKFCLSPISVQLERAPVALG